MAHMVGLQNYPHSSSAKCYEKFLILLGLELLISIGPAITYMTIPWIAAEAQNLFTMCYLYDL